MWPEGWKEQLLAGSPMLERLNGRLSIVSQVRAQLPLRRPFLHPDLRGAVKTLRSTATGVTPLAT